MDYARNALAADRARAFDARARKARGWARLVYAVLVAGFLYAAWQDRALAPPVHDGMQVVAAKISYAIENSDDLHNYVQQAFKGPSGTSAESKYDPVTRWLLKWSD